MIHNNKNELTIIIYDSPAPPRCLKINKKIIRLVLLMSSILIIVMLSVSLALGTYVKKLQNQIAGKLPESEIVESLKNENIALTEKFLELEETNKTLITQNETAKEEQIPIILKPETIKPLIPNEKTLPGPNELLSLFKMPNGFKNLISENLAEIQRINFRVKKDKTIFRFNLANSGKISKLRGYIFITQFTKKTVTFYPPLDITQNNFKINYGQGEVFTVSRFRPTIATFNRPIDESEVFYKVLIFNKAGSLILEEYHGPFNF